MKDPKRGMAILKGLGDSMQGYKNSETWNLNPATFQSSAPVNGNLDKTSNPLQAYFDANTTGRGIWKWLHYFDIYHEHFKKFIGQEVHIVEIGVFSGGSLRMWKNYFGDKCHIYGVDIEKDCKVYEEDNVKIIIGDQSDRKFWQQFKKDFPVIDIVIDDGSHYSDHQIITLEELLPHMRSGGVFVCEDVHKHLNRFNFYVNGLSLNLHTFDEQPNGEIKSTSFQSAISSIHLYPYVTVINKSPHVVEKFSTERHGTEWRPYQQV
ncbi:MAG: hypothetical protein JWN83_2338 [Chitinophagaceae bacterium]|nr:hypothetical protein [Chitinophagaceae bacterium]